MNAGAKAKHDRAVEIGFRIAQWRSEGLEYSAIGKLLEPNISASAAKQRLYRYRQIMKQD